MHGVISLSNKDDASHFGFSCTYELSFDCTKLISVKFLRLWDLCFITLNILNESNDVFSKRHFRSFNITITVVL